ncbi:HAMP domain-containing sensor histidine kinase [Actinomadura alba]|uniref:sensor histidine kinase n=1 Tax=Actinomadura alba TaxID=406431 RepID=UPI0031DEC63D
MGSRRRSPWRLGARHGVEHREWLRNGLTAVAATAAGQMLVHRLLQRIAAISEELADINAGEVYGQIAQHHDPRQVAQLVGNINATLELLDRERQFASNVAHEIRSPLTGLRLELEEALLHPDQADYPRMIDEMLHGLDRLEGLATDLLLIARCRTAQAEWAEVDLCRMVTEDVLSRSDPIPVELSCTPGVMINAMPTQISEVLTNLLNNAQRYAAHRVHVRVGRTGQVATLTVSDDGPGVPEKDKERIFDRLYRLKVTPRRGGIGTGLGLAIAREITKAHHGRIWVEASPSGGARFVVELPLAQVRIPAEPGSH